MIEDRRIAQIVIVYRVKSFPCGVPLAELKLMRKKGILAVGVQVPGVDSGGFQPVQSCLRAVLQCNDHKRRRPGSRRINGSQITKSRDLVALL